MSDNVTYQAATPATPPNATVVKTDFIGGAHYQQFKLAFGDDGTAYALGYGTPMPIGTLPGGTVVLFGTAQMLGTFQPVGTLQVLGTFQAHGTTQGLGTFQPLAGSIHPAAMFFGSVQGWQAHDGAAAGNPLLMGAYGAASAPTAVGDGDAVRLWADPSGRLQVIGTIGSITGVAVTTMPTVTVQATNLDIRDLSSATDSVSATGTVQTHGTSQVIGTTQLHGTGQFLGTAQLTGTAHVGSVQRLAGGTIDSFGGTLGGGTIQLHGTGQFLGTHSIAGSVWGGTMHRPPVATVTDGTIDGTVGNVQLLATNSARQGFSVFNDSRGAGGNLFIRYGAAAGTLRYSVRVAPGALYEAPMRYTGAVNGIWDIAGGTAQISEW